MKRIFIIMFILMCCSFYSYSQNNTAASEPAFMGIDYSSNPDYRLIKQESELYYQNHPEESTKTFHRWIGYWESRIAPFEGNDASFLPALNTLYSMAINEGDFIKCEEADNFTQNWESIGPKNRARNALGNFELPGVGRTISVWVDENNPNYMLLGAASGGLWKSTNALTNNPDDIQWTNITDFQGGSLTGINTPAMGVSGIAVNPQNNQEIIIATSLDGTRLNRYGLGLFKSNDGGLNWETTVISYPPSQATVNCDNVIAHPTLSGVYYALCENKVFRTTDSFGSIDPDNSPLDGLSLENSNGDIVGLEAGDNRIYKDLEFHPDNPDIIYLSSEDFSGGDGGAAFLRSTDGGVTWEDYDINDFGLIPVVSGITNNTEITRIDLATTKANVDRVYQCIYTRNPARTIIMHSNDSGASWNFPTNYTQSSFSDRSTAFMQSFDVSDVDPERFYLGENTAFYKSEDQGATFTVLIGNTTSNFSAEVHVDHRNVLTFDYQGTDFVYSCNDGGISASYDNGNNWSDISGQGLAIMQFSGIGVSVNGNKIAGGSIDNSLTFYEGDLTNGGSGNWHASNVGDRSDVIYHPFKDNLSGNNSEWFQQGWGSPSTSSRSIRPHSGTIDIGAINNSGRVKRPWEYSYRGENLIYGTREIYSISANWASVANDVTSKSDFTSIIGATPTLRNFDLFDLDGNRAIVSLSASTSANGVVTDYHEEHKLYLTDNLETNPNVLATWENITPPDNLLTWQGGHIFDVEFNPYNKDQFFLCTSGWNRGERPKVAIATKSEEGEWGFEDRSEGLPDVPMYELIYQAGSNGILYIGTEVGVYVNTNIFDVSSIWECYNNMPSAIISDMEINYCTGELYVSTEGRGWYKTDLIETTGRPYEISENTTWDYRRIIPHDVKVTEGNTLTITSEIYFSGDAKLAVEPGAKLIIDGGKLSTLCNDRWEGIELWGNSNLAQLPANQGYLEIKNNAIIEHANTAVKVFNPENTFFSSGGVVFADDSHFLNCSRGVHFERYSYTIPEIGIQNNLSRFRNCTFETNDDALDNTFHEHARLNAVGGIQFYACDFKDLRSQNNEISELTRGIYSFGAGFSVLPVCTSGDCSSDSDWKYSNFEGFLHAVEATTTKGTSYTYTIDRANFTNNRIGVLNRAVDNFAIVRSDFLLDAPKWNANLIGLKIDRGTQFIVEGNQFRSVNGVKERIKTGIVAIATSPSVANPDVNEIYRNSFRNISIGNLSNGDNLGSVNPDFGLKYNCNNNQDVQQFDFAVPDEPLSLVEGVSIRQGLLDEPTGNRFSQLLPNDDGSNFFNAGIPIEDYHYYTNSSSENPGIDHIGLEEIIGLNFENTCSVELENGGVVITDPLPPVVVDGLGSGVDTKRTQSNDLKVEIDALKDGGNTSQLVSEINNALAFNADELFSQLTNIAPYISKESLKALAIRTDIYSNMQIRDIIELNPDQIDSDLLSFLLNKVEPFTEQQIAQLETLQGQVTDLTHKLSQTAQLEKEINQTIRFVLQNISQTGTSYQTSSIEEWRNRLSSTANTVNKISDQLTLETTGTAQTLLNELSNEMTENDLAYTEIEQMVNIHIDLLNNDNAIYEVSASQLTTLYDLADNGTDIGGLWAQNTLNYIRNTNYQTEVIYPNEAQMNSLEDGGKEDIQLTEKDQLILARPNPASDLVQFVYDLPEEHTKGTIELRDINGRLIQSFEVKSGKGLIEYGTTDLQSGHYIFSLSTNGIILQSNQLIILK